MYNARRIATLAGAEGSRNFKLGADWFSPVVSSAKRQKKVTKEMLSQASTATQDFETARAEALQHLMR